MDPRVLRWRNQVRDLTDEVVDAEEPAEEMTKRMQLVKLWDAIFSVTSNAVDREHLYMAHTNLLALDDLSDPRRRASQGFCDHYDAALQLETRLSGVERGVAAVDLGSAARDDTQEKRLLYIVTSSWGVSYIHASGVKCRDTGTYGRGILLRKHDWHWIGKVKAKPPWAVLECQVTLGRVKVVRGASTSYTFETLRAEGFDSVYALSGDDDGDTDGDKGDYVVYNPDQVKVVNFFTWLYPYPKQESELTKTLYHVTNEKYSSSIRTSGLLCGVTGPYGAGIYFCERDWHCATKVTTKPPWVVVQCKVNIGRVKRVTETGSYNSDLLQAAGFDSVYAPLGPAGGHPEYVVYNPSQVTVVDIYPWKYSIPKSPGVACPWHRRDDAVGNNMVLVGKKRDSGDPPSSVAENPETPHAERQGLVLIVTTAKVELEAVLLYMRVAETHPQHIEGYTVYFGSFSDRLAVVCQTRQGASETFQVVSSLLASPQLRNRVKLLLAVGIAWGSQPSGAGPDGQLIGDILVAEKCISVASAKAVGGETHSRGPITECPIADRVNWILCRQWPAHFFDSWGGEQTRCHRPPKTHHGVMLSLPMLIDDEAYATTLLQRFAIHNPIGGDMELYQIVRAATFYHVDWLCAKSISDFAGMDNHKDDAHQTYAATASADLAFWLLRQDPITDLFRDDAPVAPSTFVL